MRKHTRITRVKRSNVLADIYGSLYNDYQMTRSTKPNVRKQAIKLINQLSNSEIQLHHESELNKIRELHTLLYKILNAIKTDTDGSIMTIDIDKFNTTIIMTILLLLAILLIVIIINWYK